MVCLLSLMNAKDTTTSTLSAEIVFKVLVWPQQPATAASAVAAGLPAAAAYQASSLVVRLSVKLFNCTPGDLPQGLREQLCNWLCATPAGAEGYIRPGCLILTMQVLGPLLGCCKVLLSLACAERKGF